MTTDNGRAYDTFKYYQSLRRTRYAALVMSVTGFLMVPGAVRTGNWVDFVCGLMIGAVSIALYSIVRRFRYTPPTVTYMPFDMLASIPNGQYVYVIRDIDVTGYYKIGRTRDLARRLTDFNIKLPFQIGIVLVISCADCVVLETKLHREFEAKRVGGEWFALDGTDLLKLRNIATTHGKEIMNAEKEPEVSWPDWDGVQ